MRRITWVLSSIIAAVPLAQANPIQYTITVNTASIAGTNGSLDFNFNPGPLLSQSASLKILNFTSNGGLAGTPTETGDAAGNLPGTLTFDNGTGFNDYFEGFKYGTSLSFEASLYGPALSSPDGVSTSGSTFAFTMFADPTGATPILTTDKINGYAVTIGVNLDGSTTLTSYIPTSVPEPADWLLLPGGLGLVAFGARRFGGAHKPRIELGRA